MWGTEGVKLSGVRTEGQVSTLVDPLTIVMAKRVMSLNTILVTSHPVIFKISSVTAVSYMRFI